ncbi:uncharacterized protein C7orf31 homolog [Bombina bombina]|uniref:uncharacterized protein C7orf31 homolog n=1 Tax=Bombina bombina TaxID=8345 RepID=UPI00235AD660|nr:uncharacterized protein C7orf31 homolog [Bombina bombina]
MEVQYDLSHYYRQREGALELSPTLQSSELWTPQQLPQRSTVSQQRYQEYRVNSPALSRLPWGREREYGGIGPVSLPDDHRPKSEPPVLEAKGHKHYGYGGDPWPRGIPIQQYYDITTLKKSAVRPNDELYPKPPAASMTERQISAAFPAEHPYCSHISKFAVFPSMRPPDVLKHKAPQLDQQTPARPHSAIILRKAKALETNQYIPWGNPYRHEIINTSNDSEKEALIWSGQHGYFHYPKFQENGQIFYPIPPKTRAPNTLHMSLEEMLSDRTVNLLRNLEKSQWITSYNHSFTGRGEMNPLELDDFNEKALSTFTGQADINTAMKQTFVSSILKARPLEGRKARLQDGRTLSNSDEKMTDLASKNVKHTTTSLHSPEDSGTKPTYHLTGQLMPDTEVLAGWNNSKNLPVEKQHKTYLCKNKITDNIQSGVLYERQFTQVPDNDHILNTAFYEDLKASKQNQHMIFEKLSKIRKTNVKTQENQGMLSFTNNLRHFGKTSATGAFTNAEKPRPQTALLQLQDSFSKSEANKKFQQAFPEKTKNLAENNHSGKKNTFYGFHSFYYHN